MDEDKWLPISTLPPNTEVLLYWEDSGHIENGEIFEGPENRDLRHILFDGESLNIQPSHWQPLPAPPSNSWDKISEVWEIGK